MKVSLIIPTYNEKENLSNILEKVFKVFKQAGIDGEVIVVDDNSPDGTGELADKLSHHLPVQVIHREGKLGLGSAVIEGFEVAKGEILGVMDADGSHDPSIIPRMIKAIEEEKQELVVGSRYIKGGRISNWPLKRRIISKVAIMMAAPLTRIKDRTSGFLFFKKAVVEGVPLNKVGFKIGLEIMVKGNYKRFKEIGYTFVDRKAGKSKFSIQEVFKYLKQLIQLGIYLLLKKKKRVSKNLKL